MKRVLLAVALLVTMVSCKPSQAADDGDGAGPNVATAASPTGVHCGYVRWPEKTGVDPEAATVNLTAKHAAISTLTQIKSPLPTPGKYPPHHVKRMVPVEVSTYRIKSTIVAYGVEQDNDLHLVIKDSRGKTMIVEIPNPACMGTSPWVDRVTAARNIFLARTGYVPIPPPPGQYSPKFIKSNIPVTVTGVGFFDYVHNQQGVAPNGIELHPVLSMQF